jgi:protein phosphatase-4 regulatory subunit 3
MKTLLTLSLVNDLTFQEVTLYSHLVDILTFFVRQHLFRTRNSIQSESLAPRVAQLLRAPQKHLKLGECTALFFDAESIANTDKSPSNSSAP